MKFTTKVTNCKALVTFSANYSRPHSPTIIKSLAKVTCPHQRNRINSKRLRLSLRLFPFHHQIHRSHYLINDLAPRCSYLGRSKLRGPSFATRISAIRCKMQFLINSLSLVTTTIVICQTLNETPKLRTNKKNLNSSHKLLQQRALPKKITKSRSWVGYWCMMHLHGSKDRRGFLITTLKINMLSLRHIFCLIRSTILKLLSRCSRKLHAKEISRRTKTNSSTTDFRNLICPLVNSKPNNNTQ